MKDVRFTEDMVGWYEPGAPAYDAGYYTGRHTGHRLGFRLTIGTDDLAAVRADPNHRCAAAGWVDCPSLGPGKLAVREGTFDLFAPGAVPGRLAMRYRLGFAASGGQGYVLTGVKDVAHDRPFDLWRDTSTLFVRLLRAGPDGVAGPPAGEVGRGILVLTPWMFTRQLTTFRGRPVPVARFASGFMASLAREYLRPIPKEALS